jgi:integrase
MPEYLVEWTHSGLAALAPDPKKRKSYPDPSAPGLYIRVSPNGTKVFYFVYRLGGRRAKLCWLRIAPFGHLPLPKVRRIAARHRALALSRMDPATIGRRARGGESIAEVVNRFLDEHVAKKLKSRTGASYRSFIGTQILPKLGDTLIQRLTREAVCEWHSSAVCDSGAGAVRANRALSILSSICTQAEKWGLIPQGSNPCRYVKPFNEVPRLRDIQPCELQAIGDAIRRCEDGARFNVWVLAAIKVIALCAGRVSEVLFLRRGQDMFLEKGYAVIRDHKTSSKVGGKRLELPPAAVEILQGLPQKEDSPWYFPGRGLGAPLSPACLRAAWNKICRAAGVQNLHLHDFRSFAASEGLEQGIDARTTAKLLGHTNSQTTERHYLRVREKMSALAAAQISSSIVKAFGLDAARGPEGEAT